VLGFGDAVLVLLVMELGVGEACEMIFGASAFVLGGGFLLLF
jgi:hypothetical protein